MSWLRIAVTLAMVTATIGGLPAHAATYCAPARVFLPGADTTLWGDVDGDGTTDIVSTRARTLESGSCRAWLIVRTSHGVHRSRIAPLTGLLIVPPALAGLVRLGPSPKLDIAVIIWVGASTGFLDVYGLHGGRLGRVSPQAYAYAGSVGNRSGVDCVHRRGARLVSSWASLDRDEHHYIGERDFFALRGGMLRPLTRMTERFQVRLRAIDRFPEFAAQIPFPSCTVVRGTS